MSLDYPLTARPKMASRPMFNYSLFIIPHNIIVIKCSLFAYLNFMLDAHVEYTVRSRYEKYDSRPPHGKISKYTIGRV